MIEFDPPAQCPACEWTTHGLVNYGMDGASRWMCQGCVARQLRAKDATITTLTAEVERLRSIGSTDAAITALDTLAAAYKERTAERDAAIARAEKAERERERLVETIRAKDVDSTWTAKEEANNTAERIAAWLERSIEHFPRNLDVRTVLTEGVAQIRACEWRAKEPV